MTPLFCDLISDLSFWRKFVCEYFVFIPLVYDLFIFDYIKGINTLAAGPSKFKINFSQQMTEHWINNVLFQDLDSV